MGRSHHPLVPVPFEIRVVAGPQPVGVIAIGERALIGRSAACGVRLSDPAVEAHHACLVTDGRDVVVTQLAGRLPIIVDGVAIDLCGARVEHWLEVGDTRLALDAVEPGRSTAGTIGVDASTGNPFTVAVTDGATVGVVVDDTCSAHGAMAAAVLDAIGGVAVVAPAGSPTLDTCSVLVELGARWRARVTLDRDRPLDIARVHLCQPSTGRSSVCR